MAKRTKIFYWEIVSPERAKELFQEGKTELYKLYDDDSEALIESKEDLIETIDLGLEIALQRSNY